MSNEWQVPMHPEQRNAGAQRRRRYWWGIAGGLVGVAGNLILLVLALGPAVVQDGSEDLAYAGLGVIILTGVGSLLLLITGGLLTIARRVRPFAVGLLIGTGAGLICTNGVCFAVLVALG